MVMRSGWNIPRRIFRRDGGQWGGLLSRHVTRRFGRCLIMFVFLLVEGNSIFELSGLKQDRELTGRIEIFLGKSR